MEGENREPQPEDSGMADQDLEIDHNLGDVDMSFVGSLSTHEDLGGLEP